MFFNFARLRAHSEKIAQLASRLHNTNFPVGIYVCLQIGISYYILQHTQSSYLEFYFVIYKIIYCTENVLIVTSDDNIENDFDLSIVNIKGGFDLLRDKHDKVRQVTVIVH